MTCVEDGKQALKKMEDDDFDLVLTDVRMPKLNGLELLRSVKEKSPETKVVMMTAYGTIDNAVEAMKEGAFDYLIKGSGFSADVLVSTVKRAFIEPGSFIPPVPRPSLQFETLGEIDYSSLDLADKLELTLPIAKQVMNMEKDLIKKGFENLDISALRKWIN